MFDLDEHLVSKIDSRAMQLNKDVTDNDIKIAYATLGCSTCEAFTQ